MTPITGIEAVDRELRRHKFSSPEAAEAMAMYLLGVWRVLAPCSDDAVALDRKQQQR
jgi:hypothetical protein